MTIEQFLQFVAACFFGWMIGQILWGSYLLFSLWRERRKLRRK